MKYPELFSVADNRAMRAQFLHYTLIRLEYGLLILAAITAWFADYFTIHSGVFGLAFVALVAVATISHFQKVEDQWYEARSIAEAIKSSAWLYSMRAEPFEGDSESRNVKQSFLEHLRRVANQSGPEALDRLVPGETGIQLTKQMQDIRALSVADRVTEYLKQRVSDQRKWYADRARFNVDRERLWYIVACVVYIVPLCLIVFQVIDVSSEWALVSIFLLIGSGLMGWTKSRRYKELSLSYVVAARELDFLIENIAEINSEASLSELVLTAESILTREHKHWFVRQMNKA